MKVGLLQFHTENSGFPTALRTWVNLASQQGIEMESIPLIYTDKASWLAAYKKAESLVEEADALVILKGSVLAGYKELIPKVQKRIVEGSRMIVADDPNNTEVMETLLVPFGMSFTNIGMIPNILKESSESSKFSDLVVIQRSPYSFRDPSLFSGVNEVRLRYPTAIWYTDEAMPVLVSDDTYSLVDKVTDLYYSFTAREDACMAVYHHESGGAVLTVPHDLLCDTASNVGTQARRCGIDSNLKLAENLLKFVGMIQNGATHVTTPEEYYHRIEINLADFVLDTVKTKIGADWWSKGIPPAIRTKCATRHEEEECKYPKETYLDFIDMKSIIESSWTLFEPRFLECGISGGKQKSLSWFNKLNELRRMIGHPLKKHLAGYTFASEDIRLLSESCSLVLKLKGSKPNVSP